jgi:predicted DNA-binding transcriptional regulator AlpA
MSTEATKAPRTVIRTKGASRLLTHREVAARVSIDTETLRGWVADGEWPEPLAIIKQTWFYPAGQIEHFIATGQWPDGTKFKSGVGKGRELPVE